jgi:predicted nuclease with TOPRIM domain
MEKLTCINCKGTGKLSKFQSSQMKGQLEQLREKVASLKLSRDDLIARATDLQGKLNAMKNEVNQAIDLADFYEKQGLENERLADLLKIFIGVMIQSGIDVPDAGKASDTVHNAFRLLKVARSCIRDFYALNKAQSEPMLLEAINQLFSLEQKKRPKQVSAEDEDAILDIIREEGN